MGIYHYGARFYSPKLGRFLSADTIVPNPFNPQDYNRFAYVRNNPVRYVDPSGHVCVQNGGGVDNEFGIAGNCNGGEKANYKNPFPGGVPAVNKPGKPKKDDDGRDGKSVDPSTPLVTIVPDGPGCQELYCDSPQLISTNIEVIDDFEAYWQDVGETVTLTVLGLGVAETAPAVVVIINNPYVKIVLAPVTAAISLAMNSPGTREGDVIVTETYVVGESTSTCYGYTYFTNTIVKTTIYDSEGNLVYSETERITGYCYQR
ncbi:MAG: RHS repeat-associated core domain-containing protein [Chloroflexota bacterium]